MEKFDETTIICLSTLLEDVCDADLIAGNGVDVVDICRDNSGIYPIMIDIKMRY